MISLISKVRKSLFKNELNNIAIGFIVHKTKEEIKLEFLLVYNKNQNINENFYENKYLIINYRKEVKKINYKSLQENLEQCFIFLKSTIF